MSISKRKQEHIKIVRDKDVVSSISPGFEDIFLVPKALPEINFDEIDTSLNFLRKKLFAPIMISSVTGGTKEAQKINEIFARAAQKYNIAFSVGSQKAMIKDSDLDYTYKVRKFAPDILLIGNIGIDYLLCAEFDLEKLKLALETIGADALYIHVNVLQEMAQPEGSKNFSGALKKIKEVAKHIGLPVLIKEVGAGIDRDTAIALEKAGVDGIDVAGVGGTSWAAVESFRGSEIGEEFRDWGIPTALSLLLVDRSVKLPIVASGGLKSGQDVAKSVVLGADIAGFAQVFFKAALESEEKLYKTIEKIITELKTTMILVGAKNISELKKTEYLIKGQTKEAFDQFNIPD